MDSILSRLERGDFEKIHSGKVRDSYRYDDRHRIIRVTDRLSCFDKILSSTFSGKGALLNQLSARWFEWTKPIVPNHFVKLLAPNMSLVREAQPIRVEMIVRQFLTGSLWRAYKDGQRVYSGYVLKEGLLKNQTFDEPIVTPTTKEESDRQMSPQELVEESWVSQECYDQMKKVSLELFKYGQDYSKSRGLVLVDAKYEFGLIDGELCLIDEIHTPDCARFCEESEAPLDAESPWLDKEFIRQYLLSEGKKLDVPQHVLEEAKRRYMKVFKSLTEEECRV